jgi:hypothetical protein
LKKLERNCCEFKKFPQKFACMGYRGCFGFARFCRRHRPPDSHSEAKSGSFVTSLGPTALAPTNSSYTLLVTGTGFVPTSSVNWNGLRISDTTVLNNAELLATIPAG